MSGPMHSSFRHLLNSTITFTLASGEELIYPIREHNSTDTCYYRRDQMGLVAKINGYLSPLDKDNYDNFMLNSSSQRIQLVATR